MPISPYVQELREHLGHRLLLLPGVAAIVRDPSGHILLHCRADSRRWALPAGAIDPGESPAEAVVREVREETGLRVRPERIAAVFGGKSWSHTYPNGDRVEPTTIVFDCSIVGGELSTDAEETAGLRFFPPDEVIGTGIGYPPELFAAPGERALFTPPGGDGG